MVANIHRCFSQTVFFLIPFALFLFPVESRSNVRLDFDISIQPTSIKLNCHKVFRDVDRQRIPYKIDENFRSDRPRSGRYDGIANNLENKVTRLITQGFKRQRDEVEEGLVYAVLEYPYSVEVKVDLALSLQAKANRRGATHYLSDARPDFKTRSKPKNAINVVTRDARGRTASKMKKWQEQQQNSLNNIFERINGKRSRWKDAELNQLQNQNRGTFVRNFRFSYCGQSHSVRYVFAWRRYVDRALGE